MKKKSRHIPKGMVKDVSASKLGQDYYIDALNIKITATDGNTGYSISNLKSNALIRDFGDAVYYVGHIALNQYLVVFLTKPSASTDLIIRINTNDLTAPSKDTGTGYTEYTVIAEGDFGFSTDYPIEGIGIYEKEDVQKVYWIDGKNQPRYLNIVREDVPIESPSELNFVKTLALDEKITVTRNETTIGSISAGTMQYVFTYYNRYGSETNIIYTSSLYYISYNNRGASAEDTTVSTSFSIVAQNLDKNFEYLRIYSIHRSSINDTPDVRRVADLEVPEDGVIAFVDDGTLGESVDPTLLLYVGGKSVVPNTMEQKDAVLFLGNYKEPNSLVAQDKQTREDIKELAKKQEISFDSTKNVEGSDFKGYYNYNNQLSQSQSDITCYKYGETYRFGFQAQKSTGEWSEPIFIGDKENTQPIQMLEDTWSSFGETQQFSTDSNNGFRVAVPSVQLSSALIEKLQGEGYIKVRPMVVFPTQTDRTCICQGILCPTVFNVSDRISNSPYVQSSWFFRPNAPIDQDSVVVGENDTDSSTDSSAAGITYENGTWYEIITSADGISSETLANCVGGRLKFSVTSTESVTYSFDVIIKGYILSQDGGYIAWFTDSSSVYFEYLATEESFPLDGTKNPTILVEITPAGSSSDSTDDSDTGDGTDSDTGNDDDTDFNYDYDTFQTAVNTSSTLRYYDLNKFYIYNENSSLWDDMYPSDKEVRLYKKDDSSSVIRTGKMVTVNSVNTTYSDGTTFKKTNTDDLSCLLFYSSYIKEGELEAGYYTFVFEAGTWGDSNYKKYLQGDTSVKASDCHVNPRMTCTVYIGVDSSSSDSNTGSTELKSVTFDFTSPLTLDPIIAPSETMGGGVSVDNTVFTALTDGKGTTFSACNSEEGKDCKIYTTNDIETGETTYCLYLPSGSRIVIHPQGSIYGRRLDIVEMDTEEVSTIWESSANASLMYACIDNITTNKYIKSAIFYYVDSTSSSLTSAKSSSDDDESSASEEESSVSANAEVSVASEAAELAVYNGSSSGVYAAVFGINMPKTVTRSGKLVWNAGIYSKDYYVLTSRYLRTLLTPESKLVTIQLLADTSLTDDSGSTTLSNKYTTGSSTEFRHWHQIPNANHVNAEIQCNYVCSYNLDQNDSYVNGYSNFLEQTLSVDLNNEYEIKYFPTQEVAERSSETWRSIVQKILGSYSNDIDWRNPFNGISPTYTTTVKLTTQNFKDSFSDMYFIDQSVLTFHSPDIEFDTTTHSIDESSLKLRLVGYVPITSTISDVDIQASTIALNYWKQATTAPGFLHSTIGSIGQKGWRGLNTDSLWWDEEWYSGINDDNTHENPALFTTGFLTYPWHRSGSLNNQPAQTYTSSDANDTEDVSISDTTLYRSAVLQRKVMSNLRYSFNTVYCCQDSNGVTQPLTVRMSEFNTLLPNGNNLSSISLFDTDQVLNIRLLAQDDSGDTFNYYGNIDKLLSSSRKYYLDTDTSTIGYPIFKGKRDVLPNSLSICEYGEDNISIVTDCVNHNYYKQESDDGNKVWVREAIIDGTCKNYQFGTDPVLMKYKTTPHAVLSLKYTDDNTVHILPTGTDNAGSTGSQKIYIVPDTRTKSEAMTKYNSTFECPANTVLTGVRQNSGKVWYEYATLKAVDSSGNTIDAVITLKSYQWSVLTYDKQGTEYAASDGRVLTGRQCIGGENNGANKYQTAVISIDGNPITLSETLTSINIADIDNLWYSTDDQRVLTGRGMSSSEAGEYYYLSSKLLYTKISTVSSVSTQAVNKIDFTGIVPFWDDTKTLSVQQETVYVQPKYGYLWMGELVNTKHSIDKEGKLVDDDSEDAVSSVRFGGTSDSAIQNNTWLVAGDSVSLDGTLMWTQGDTYYQRYDCLKTYPFTQDDANSVVDICSFMVETRVNIDGRYDRNRGQISNLQMTPQNFNLLNPAYSQLNNYFSYKVLDAELFNTDTYRNYITWSKSKTYGEEADTWTNVTLANVLDLDGNKGDVRCLKLFNNTLLCFQDKAVSQILYNEQVQLSTEQGVPVELSNSDKVQGKRYLTNTIGCCDKWTVKSTPFGLFFMDYLDPAIYVYTGQQFTNLTESLGLSSWAKNNIGYSKSRRYDSGQPELKSWKPYTWQHDSIKTGENRCFRTHFDPLTNNVYFTGTADDDADCLVFSTQLQQFTCFQSLGKSQMIEAVQNKAFVWKGSSYYMQEAGDDYGMFCGEYYPYYVTYIENQDPMTDKTFSTLDFRATVEGEGNYGSNGKFSFTLPFSTLETWNDYQAGKATLSEKNGHESFLHHTSDKSGALKRKFRAWHCDIPRDNVGVFKDRTGKLVIHPLDRMRNPWLYFKLQGEAKRQMELHDMIIDYFE